MDPDKDFTITYTYGSYGDKADYGERARVLVPASGETEAGRLAGRVLARYHDWFCIDNIHAATDQEKINVDYIL